MAIRKLTISGFRGILAPLSLDFAAKDGAVRSMVVYGRNGTGKSSITDAWEWVHMEGIAHLGREGAGPSAYPHRSAADGQSYVEIEFADLSLGVRRAPIVFAAPVVSVAGERATQEGKNRRARPTPR